MKQIINWDASSWLRQFNIAKKADDFQQMRNLRIQVYEDTIVDVLTGRYMASSGDMVEFDDDSRMRVQTELYSESIKILPVHQTFNNTKIEVIEHDTLSVAKQLVDANECPAVLNMANGRNPGGGVLSGSGAQEESLFRCSNYFRSLYQFATYAGAYGLQMREKLYPLDNTYGGVYSPDVTVFRENEAQGYLKIDKPWKVSFIAVPALHNPTLIKDNHGLYWLADPMKAITLNKIRTILRIAICHGHTTLVLEAFGCGAFANPSQHIAKLFHEVLSGPEYSEAFSHIVFAIIENHNSYQWFNPEGNVKPFRDEFGRW